MSLRRPAKFAMLATAFTLLAAVGCSSGSSTSTSTSSGVTVAKIGPLETNTINVAAVPTTDSTGLYVAEYDGLFAKYGLHVNIEPAISAEQSVNQLAFNQIQILTGNYVSFLEAQINYDHGVQPANVKFPPGPNDNQISANLDIFAEASVMQPGFVGLFTKPGSKIRNISQLKGKTIGINAPNNVAYLLLASWEKANGLEPTPPNLIRIIPFPNMEDNLMKGNVDVAFLAEPFVSISEETAGVIEMTNLDEGATTGFPIQGYAATKAWAKTHPNTLAAFEAALQQGQQIAGTNRGMAEKATVQYGLLPSMPKTTPLNFANQIATLLQFESYPLGQVDVTRLQRVLNVMKQFNVFPVPSDFDVRQLLGD
ncbi:MAG TPA: ABC transporter substrate-binding protein [Streptosporangiaceae bacterium]